MSQVSFVMPLYGNGPRLCSIEYDLLGKATKFSLNGVALLTKVYDYDNNSVTAQYHRGEGAEDEICTEYDKYGRVKAIKHNGASALELTYEDESAAAGFEESPSCADIKTSRDECIGANYTYDYDEYTGKLTGYRVSGVGMSMHVFSAGSDKVKYEFDEGYLDYEDQITYDENCLIEPRIVKAYNNSDWGIDWNISYDKLGRVNRREEDYNFWLGECPVMEVTYKPGTGLKEQIKYSKKGYSETVSQKYDSRGNIVGITDEYSGAFTGKDEYEYSYDSLNRIVGEKVTGIISYSRTYAYDSEGNISRVTQDGEEERYEYSQGRLTRIKVNGTIKKQYSYDAYGNPVDYAGEAMEWERGTQLKSYLGQSYTYDAQGHLYGKIWRRADVDKLLRRRQADSAQGRLQQMADNPLFLRYGGNSGLQDRDVGQVHLCQGRAGQRSRPDERRADNSEVCVRRVGELHGNGSGRRRDNCVGRPSGIEPHTVEEPILRCGYGAVPYRSEVVRPGDWQIHKQRKP